ncbi:MAG: carotenoid biosynthesis protein [Kiritimatiellia bacterium]|jgi:putative membrane protein|nr:carotenoid biosynthesis protein [Kiritimatiellia bacterium]
MNQPTSKTWTGYSQIVGGVLLLLYTVGVVGHNVTATLPLMIWLTPGFLLLTATLATLPAAAVGRGKFLVWLTGAYGCTFAAEALGVATGLIFGHYEYGPALGWSWLGVPLIIAFNWVVVVNGAVSIADRVVPATIKMGRRPALALLAGLIATVFDFIMEPVAIHLDYWRWPDNAVPSQNYVAWFVIAALAAALYPLPNRLSPQALAAGRLAGTFVVVQAAFFIALRIGWYFS